MALKLKVEKYYKKGCGTSTSYKLSGKEATMKLKEQLKQYKSRYSPYLVGGPGWIVGKARYDKDVKVWLLSLPREEYDIEFPEKKEKEKELENKNETIPLSKLVDIDSVTPVVKTVWLERSEYFKEDGSLGYSYKYPPKTTQTPDKYYPKEVLYLRTRSRLSRDKTLGVENKEGKFLEARDVSFKGGILLLFPNTMDNTEIIQDSNNVNLVDVDYECPNHDSEILECIDGALDVPYHRLIVWKRYTTRSYVVTHKHWLHIIDVIKKFKTQH